MNAQRILFEGLENRILLTALTATETYVVTVDNGGLDFSAGDSGNFNVPQFDDESGSRTLKTVDLSITLNSFGGVHVFDNEDDVAADVDLTIGTRAFNFQYGAQTFPNLDATASEAGAPTPDPPGTVGPNDDAFPPTIGTGDDFTLTGTSSTTDDADSLTSPPTDLSPFVGAGNLTINFDSEVEASLVTNVGSFISGVNPAPTFNFVATITYTYVPEPDLAITKGVVSSQAPGAYNPGVVGPVVFSPPASAGVRFSGQTIESTSLPTTPVDSDLTISQVSPGNLVSFAIIVENSGGNELGAYDIQITDTIPDGFEIPTGGAGLNLFVSDGAGNPVTYNPVDPGFAGPAAEALFDAQGIELVDPADSVPGTGAAVGPYEPDVPDNGNNILVLTYDLAVVAGYDPGSHINTATCTYVAGSNGGPNELSAPISDPAEVILPAETPYRWDVFNDWRRGGPVEEPDVVRQMAFQPLYSGTAQPGATLSVDVYNARGDLIGSESAVADAAGNWATSFFNTTIEDEPHTIVLRQTYAPSYGGLADAGYNLRTYFVPAIQGGTFVSEQLTVENVTGNRANDNAFNALRAASLHPITLGWSAYPFESLAQPATASGT